MSTSFPAAPAARSPSGRRLGLLAAKLTLSAVVFALCMLLGEGAVRLLGFQPIWSFYSKPSVFWRHDELLGWSHTPNTRGSYVGPKPWPIEFNTPVEINSDGLRGPDVTSLPEHGRRVLFIGDSMLAAFEVPYEKTFAVLIGAELTRTLGVPVQVINAGVRGYGTDQSYLYFRERGSKYRPDAVVLIQSANDFRENTEVHRMMQPLGKPAFRLSPDGSLVLLGHPVPNYPICSQFNVTPQFELVRTDSLFQRAWCGIETRVLDYSALGAVVTYGLARHPRLLTAIYRGTQPKAAFDVVEEQSCRLTEALLRALGSEVVRVSGRSLLVTGEDISLEGVDWRRVADVIDVFSYEEILRDRKDEIKFKNDGHLTELGHERVAGLVAPRLAELLAQPASRAQVAGQ
jgi:lysophospholipase L1-like esterase